MKELIVIGQGPAGISAALYAVRGGAPVTVVAKDGGALERAGLIQNYYGFDGGVQAKDLIAAGVRQAKALGVRFVQAEVYGIAFGEGGYDAETSAGALHGGALVLAVGTARNVPKIENIQKFEGAGVSYCAVCDAFFFRGKKVGVIGSGAYAAAEYAHLKGVTENVTVLSDGQPPAFAGIPCDARKIAALEGGNSLEGVVFADGTKEHYDGLFVACGSAGAFELAKKLGLQTDGGKIVTDEKRATDAPGVFAAGDCVAGMQQIAKAVCDGMIAGTEALRYLKALG